MPRQAFSAHAILACVGESAFAEKPGDISELELPQGISAFVKDLRKVSDDRTPIILALLEGRPRLLRDIPRTVRLRLGQACNIRGSDVAVLGTTITAINSDRRYHAVIIVPSDSSSSLS